MATPLKTRVRAMKFLAKKKVTWERKCLTANKFGCDVNTVHRLYERWDGTDKSLEPKLSAPTKNCTWHTDDEKKEIIIKMDTYKDHQIWSGYSMLHGELVEQGYARSVSAHLEIIVFETISVDVLLTSKNDTKRRNFITFR